MDVASKRRRPLSFAGTVLEDECPVCKGTGDDKKPRFFADLVGVKHCDHCVGKGYMLNDSGKVICDLILTHMTGDDSGLRMKGSK